MFETLELTMVGRFENQNVQSEQCIIDSPKFRANYWLAKGQEEMESLTVDNDGIRLI